MTGVKRCSAPGGCRRELVWAKTRDADLKESHTGVAENVLCTCGGRGGASVRVRWDMCVGVASGGAVAFSHGKRPPATTVEAVWKCGMSVRTTGPSRV